MIAKLAQGIFVHRHLQLSKFLFERIGCETVTPGFRSTTKRLLDIRAIGWRSQSFEDYNQLGPDLIESSGRKVVFARRFRALHDAFDGRMNFVVIGPAIPA